MNSYRCWYKSREGFAYRNAGFAPACGFMGLFKKHCGLPILRVRVMRKG